MVQLTAIKVMEITQKHKYRWPVNTSSLIFECSLLCYVLVFFSFFYVCIWTDVCNKGFIKYYYKLLAAMIALMALTVINLKVRYLIIMSHTCEYSGLM